MNEFRVMWFSNQEGEVWGATLQGRRPELPDWIDIRPLIQDAQTQLPIVVFPTREDIEKLEQDCKVAELETLVKDLEIAKNGAYRERNLCVGALAAMARLLGYTVGIADHQPQDGEEWKIEWSKVLFIELPTGQVSWHLHISEWDNFAHIPPYLGRWDGHDTEEKYRRLQVFFWSAFQ